MTQEEFVDQLRSYVGVSFWHCGRSRTGVDCIGLPICAARDLGVEISDIDRYTVHVDPDVLLGNIERYCRPVPCEDRQPGDILVFTSRRNPQHIAVMTGPNTMIHAWDAVGHVEEHVITSAWLKVLYCAYRWGGW